MMNEKRKTFLDTNHMIVRTIFATFILLLLSAGAVAPTFDDDGDFQTDDEGDCDDSDYYTFNGAINIPFDGKANDCYLIFDSQLYDINDSSPPSNDATYYKGETVTLIGNYFRANTQILIIILDSENRTYMAEGKIRDYDLDDYVWLGPITIDSSGNINKTIILPDLEKHPTGIYTIYIEYSNAIGGQDEYIPVETFTVVENHAPNVTPHRLQIHQ